MDHALLKSVAEQLMAGAAASEETGTGQIFLQRGPSQNPQLREVVVGGRRFRVERTGTNRFRTVRFEIEGKTYQAIEQNPEKPSRWGKLARDGHRVVQFRDVASGKYVAVVVDDKVTEYGRSGE